MAARPDTARKILLYWMDAAIGFLGVLSLGFVITSALQGAMSPLIAIVAGALTAAFFALCPFLLRGAFDAPSRPTPRLALAGVLAMGGVLLLPPDGATWSAWIQNSTLWLSVAALYLPLRAVAGLTVAVTGLSTVYVAATTDGLWPATLLSCLLNAVLLVGAMLLWRWLWWVIRDAHHSREAKARLAVAEERLRFARDLHDLLGHGLSVITLKSELAAKLATKDPARAAAELAEVRALAGDSLYRVQQAVHGYQALDLDEELAGVRAALEAAGARCVIDARADGLSPAARALLAWAVREGGTNVLKHSTATRCAIRIDGGVLEMVNDGVREPPAPPGNGLRGLGERLVAAGGSVSATPTPDGEFLLRAAVPA
ncbi:MAG TPA: histidine kinase [Nonomuraea sp.]|nr:histidine kinase [Nonomuraea sp.]